MSQAQNGFENSAAQWLCVKNPGILEEKFGFLGNPASFKTWPHPKHTHTVEQDLYILSPYCMIAGGF